METLLSVVIVNYRVKWLLEQTLASVMEATEGLPTQVIVVDNNSGESWGVIEDGYAFINKSVFENFLKNSGYSFKPFMNWARLHNKLKFEDHGEGNERRLTIRKVLPSGRLRCVAIRMDDSEIYGRTPEQEAYQLAADEIPEDMPF